MATIRSWNHDSGGRDTVFYTDDGRIVRTGAAGTRCFRDITTQFGEAVGRDGIGGRLISCSGSIASLLTSHVRRSRPARRLS